MRSFRKKLRIWYNGLTGPIPDPDRWCFLVGCYNSGTTLLHRILASHPSIGSLPNEGQFYSDVLPLPMELGLPRLWALKPALFTLRRGEGRQLNKKKLLRQWGAVVNDLSRPVIIEKSPTNAARVLWLEENFRNAHFIGIIRNGYAVAEGIQRKAKHSIEKCAEQWAKSNEILLRDIAETERHKLIRYEDLTANPAAVINELLEFLGLSDDELVSRDGKWAIHEQHSVIQNMNHKSFEALPDEDAGKIKAVAGPMLSKLGYDLNFKNDVPTD